MCNGAAVENFDVAGISLFAWIDMYNSFQRSGDWPDGGAYMDQPSIVVEMFREIETTERRESAVKARRAQGNRNV